VYSSRIDQVPSPRDTRGANLLARWSAPLSEDSELTVQAYVDHSFRNQPGLFRQTLDTVDATVQYGTRPWSGHRLLTGAGYRLARDHSETPGPALTFIPGTTTLDWGHAFAQDEIALRDDLRLTVGAKVETNKYTGSEFLPNLRLAWQPEAHRLLWGAATRAVRAPARIDRDLFQPASPPHFILNGGPNFVSEIADVVELGYREQRGESLYWSATVFHNRFDRLRSVEPRPGGMQFENLLKGRVVGIEAWGEWRVTPAWRLAAGAVRQQVDFERKAGSADVAGLASLSFDPDGWWTLRSSLDLAHDVEFDVMARRVGGLPAVKAPPYTAVDVRLGWRPQPALELSLTLQNAFDPGHVEWGPASGPEQHPRTAFLRIVWRQ
jgi:iron complex outermembrane receptor protein